MKNFPKVQKKSVNSHRSLENKLCVLDNFEEIVEKQLMDDFKVHEYLNDNPNEQENNQQYIDLFNQLLVKKKHKIQRKNLLENTKASFKDRGIKNDSIEGAESTNACGDTYYSQEQYHAIKEESEIQQAAIEIKTEEELEMRKILWKEITEKKKSLNLLKGDIGHMISRNESISVLESKVNKVSLVSENQLKRVSMALAKDREEVHLRQEMQKKFHCKLKVLESAQLKNLKKIRSSYIETMKRKKQIFQKLYQIEKQCTSIEEYSDKEKQRAEKNLKTLNTFDLLESLCKVIKKMPLYWEKFLRKQINLQLYQTHLKDEFENLINSVMKNDSKINHSINDVTEQALQGFIDIIDTQYQGLEKQIDEKKKVYNRLMGNLEECWYKISELETKKESIWTDFSQQQQNQLLNHDFNLSEYCRVLRSYEQNLKPIYLLLSFFSKRLSRFDGAVYISTLYSNYFYHYLIANVRSDSQTKVNFKQNAFEELTQKLQDWFKKLLQNYQYRKLASANPNHMSASHPAPHSQALEVKPLSFTQNFAKTHQSRFGTDSSKSKNKETNFQFQTEEEEQVEDIDEGGQALPHLLLYDSSNMQNNTNQISYSLVNQIVGQPSPTLVAALNINNSLNVNNSSNGNSKSNSNHENEKQAAQRVQLLESIDKTYYKMIKQTLEMEKENTRKNYEFKKNFKRTKYACQDELLEEKRFQASFSGLFKHNTDDSNRTPKYIKSNSKFSKMSSNSANSKKYVISCHSASSPKSELFALTSPTSLKSGPRASLWEMNNKKRLSSKLKNLLQAL